jgi:DNA repair exonuclease SbcCD ATPase subunit
MDAAAGLAGAQVAQQNATVRLQHADAALVAANQTIARLESKLASEQEAAKRVEELNATITAEHEMLRDLSILKQALGPKGARALKIDAAGPAISTITNTLLRECFGSRFTILIKTQKSLIKDDSELRECLEFYIIDHETGEESPVEQKSGGEQQLIREVVSLALCIYQRKQTGADLRTVIRDEACSALTEANSMKYVVMLQKACEIGEFDQVLFVSHKTCAQGLAGATIHVMNGGIIG